MLYGILMHYNINNHKANTLFFLQVQTSGQKLVKQSVVKQNYLEAAFLKHKFS